MFLELHVYIDVTVSEMWFTAAHPGRNIADVRSNRWLRLQGRSREKYGRAWSVQNLIAKI